jgi:DNA-binding SARP family transcriptional activator
MAKLSVSLLGGFSVTLDGRPVTNFESNKVRALLAYLVTEADRAHSRDKLAALLWPDMSDQAARSNLRYALSNLRKAIGDGSASQPVLCISKQTVQLDLDSNLEADVLTFNRQLAQSPRGLSNLEEATRVYQGDFLDGFSIGSDSAFEEWVVLKREQLRRQALETLHHLTHAYRANGDLANALTAAWRLVDLEPWSEESHRDLMLLLGLSGRRAAALSQYETCRRVLAEELGVEPSAETTHIYEQIRDGRIKPSTQIPEPASQPAKEQGEVKIESSRSGSEPNVLNSGKQTPWRKVAFVGLLVILLCAGGYYFLNRSKARMPVASTVRGEIVGRCSGQVLPSICIINAQTGLATQVIKDLPIDELGPGF